MSTSTTLAQKSNVIGFPKAGELIEIAGAHALTSSDRAILNLLISMLMTPVASARKTQNGRSRLGLLAIPAMSQMTTSGCVCCA